MLRDVKNTDQMIREVYDNVRDMVDKHRQRFHPICDPVELNEVLRLLKRDWDMKRGL